MKTNKVSFEKRCLICSDLDGTLLNSKNKISKYSFKVINKLINLGHVFCINTSRPFNSAVKFYRQLHLTTPIVCHNGAYLFSPNKGDFLNTNWCISHQIVKALLEDKQLMKLVYNALIDAERCSYIINASRSSAAKIYKIINELGIYTTKDIRQLRGNVNAFKDTAYAIIFFPNNQKQLMDLIRYIKLKVPTVITTIWKISETVGSVVKVCSPYCSKGMGLSLLSSYFGIPASRCIAFGDGRDDADMLKFADYGFAMKNGCDEAQMNANYITRWTNDDDGVAKTINKGFKIGFKNK